MTSLPLHHRSTIIGWATIDDSLLEPLSLFRWSLSPTASGPRVRGFDRRVHPPVSLMLHRLVFILSTTDTTRWPEILTSQGLYDASSLTQRVRFIDGNHLNCQMENLDATLSNFVKASVRRNATTRLTETTRGTGGGPDLGFDPLETHDSNLYPPDPDLLLSPTDEGLAYKPSESPDDAVDRVLSKLRRPPNPPLGAESVVANNPAAGTASPPGAESQPGSNPPPAPPLSGGPQHEGLEVDQGSNP